MSQVKLLVETNGRTVNLEIAETTDQQRDNIIFGLFEMFGVSRRPAAVRPQKQVVIEKIESPKIELPQAPEPPETKPAERPRVLPKINDQRTLSVTIGETAGDDLSKLKQEMTGQQDGIYITDDGKKLYQVGYNCAKCWRSGTRFMPETNKYVKCKECGAKLKMRPATEKGFPDRDEKGNYFFADELYEG